MRKIEDVMGAEPGVFGPGTDLVISLSAILMLVVALQAALSKQRIADTDSNLAICYQELDTARDDVTRLDEGFGLCEKRLDRITGGIDLSKVRENQRRLAESVAREFPNSVEIAIDQAGTFALDIDGDLSPDISFHSELTRQRISFGSHILFDPDSINLNIQGRKVLARFSVALLSQLGSIEEIHIEGHADSSPTRHGSNLKLGGLRAITVFDELGRNRISPYRTIMSASSFGEFISVERFKRILDGSRIYTPTRLMEVDNGTPARKRLNRRIELLLVYTRQL